MIPPSLFRVRIVDKGRKKIGLWLPLFLLWPLLFFIILALPLLLALEIILRLFRSKRRPAQFTWVILALFFALRGLTVDVQSGAKNSAVLIKIF